MWNKNKIEKHPQKQLSLLVLFFLPLFLQAKYRQATATSSRPQHWASERRQEEVHSQPLTAFISACLGSVKKNHTFHKKKKKSFQLPSGKFHWKNGNIETKELQK